MTPHVCLSKSLFFSQKSNRLPNMTPSVHSLALLQLSVTAIVSCAFVMVAHFFGLPASGLEHITSGDWAAVANWPWLPMAYTGVLSTALCLWIEVRDLNGI